MKTLVLLLALLSSLTSLAAYTPGTVSSSATKPRIGWVTFASSSGVITRQSGSWLSSVTRNGAGDYTLNITAGEFSVAPTCVCNVDNNSATVGTCVFRNDLTAITATAVRLTTSTAGTASDMNSVHVTCMGIHI